jgi:hypothetical protein
VLLGVFAPAALADGSLELSANPNPVALGGTSTLDIRGTFPTTGGNLNGPYAYSVGYIVQPGNGQCPAQSQDADTRPAAGGDAGTSFDQQADAYGVNGTGDYRVCAWMWARDSTDGSYQGDVMTATTVLTVKQGTLDFHLSAPKSVRVRHKLTLQVHATTDGAAQLVIMLMQGRKCPPQPDYDHGRPLYDGVTVTSQAPFDRKRTLKVGKTGRYVVCGWARTAPTSVSLFDAAPFRVHR